MSYIILFSLWFTTDCSKNGLGGGRFNINLYIYVNVYVEHKTFEVCNTDNFKTSCSKEHCLEEHENVRDIKAALVSVTTTHRSCRIPLVVAEKKNAHVKVALLCG